MSKVIIFSRVFPKHHPKSGKQTYFVEKIWESINYDIPGDLHSSLVKESGNYLFREDILPKHHTIRAGKHWKVGEKFSPRVWSGKPYMSKQIIIAPDIEIKKIWDIGLRISGDFKEFYCNDCDLTGTSISKIAENDGLELNDFLSWFNKPFEGQIICWNNKIKY